VLLSGRHGDHLLISEFRRRPSRHTFLVLDSDNSKAKRAEVRPFLDERRSGQADRRTGGHADGRTDERKEKTDGGHGTVGRTDERT